ncbi:formate dehydrogenase accessory sulfurtransferase FdhD [Pedosphaera parvula]|uniref:Sulfur carrier protein FdhD n=1 Tax=Pedosphaera parvula (strain Ellin514) TaxID=320771 RepID=B9XQ02_PEDPL|nr:formate dehydrogenase accessory sulfurtransferase FdhD [Pedosphaera parvula]EEF58099.1 formate dehydrogenase family accessory protein FdhD [Pedosphaera parvula Ellin514]
MTNEQKQQTGGSEITPAKVLRWRVGGKLLEEDDQLVTEEPLEIRVRGKSVAITMRTPGQDEELAVGFLLTEGIIKRRSDVVEVAYCQQGEAANYQNTVNVFLAPDVAVNFEELTRHVFASSSCGLCGKASIESVHQHFTPVDSNVTIAPEMILQLPDCLRSAQETFSKTGGLHGAGIFDVQGNLLVMREDVGRHNAVDKVLGHCFLKQISLSNHVLLVSGRASFEIMQKALAARIPIVCAVSAPSSLAVEFARESGQTLVGFLRGGSMNIYSHPQRVIVLGCS